MNELLKILHLEDLPDDVEMVARELKKAGVLFETFSVDNKSDFIKALKEYSPDIILSDHSLPSFDSYEALKIVQELGITVPFILVTATVSEEYAVNIIKEGAGDYVLKDRLQRLPIAIANAIDKHNMEIIRKQADETLRVSERKYKLLFESNPLPMLMISKSNLNIIAVNEAAVKHYGYSKQEFLTLNAKDLRPQEDIDKYVEYIKIKNALSSKSRIWRHIKKDGTVIMVDIIAHNVTYENKPARLVLANDVTEKLKAEADLVQQRILQQKIITETSLHVQEQEREEIGKELHDNINQILAASKLYLRHAIVDEHLYSESLQRSEENIDLAIQEIRKLSQALVAPSLGDITLIDAVRGLISLFGLATSLHLSVNSNDYDEDSIDKNVKLMLYRIIQEQINNVIKHSSAKNVAIQITGTIDKIVLIVKDDGVGFDTSKISGGIGLRNIATRAGLFDGISRIISAPGKGCRLEVIIPLRSIEKI